MKILILTSSNPYVTAGVVAHNLFTGLKEKGHYTKIIVREYGKYEEGIINIDKWSDVIRVKIKNKLQRILKKYFNIEKSKVLLDDDYTIHDYDLTKKYYKTSEILKHLDFKPDIILYLFPQWFLNVENLYELNQYTGAPIFWYSMDPALLTGGCHYFWDCNRYLTGCGKCPGMYSKEENDQSKINFEFKKKFIDKTDLSIITGTKIDLERTKKSLLFRNKQVHKIFLPVDYSIFKPVSKDMVRDKLDLPKDEMIFFFGSADLSDKRKGIMDLVKALKIIKKKDENINLFLLIAGKRFDFIDGKLPFNYKYLGNLENNHQLASAFQASDFFICPSIEDAGPFMINQSVMCGTPVVSFELGIALDLVIPNETGFLAELKNIDDLANNIIKANSLKNDKLKEMSIKCRKLGLEKLKLDSFVDNFEKVISTKKH